MNYSQPFPPDPNSAVDDISDFLRDYSISAPNRQALVYGATYGSSAAPATDHSRPRFPMPAHPPMAPTPRHRTHTGTSASTTPSMTFDIDSHSISSYTRYADSIPTTGPSFGSNVLPGDGEYVLPCEFMGYDSCDQHFYPVDVDQWIDHIIVDHLQNQLPNKSNCWFCDNINFDAGRDHTDKASSFRNRLKHIRDHIRDDGLGIHNMRPDYDLVAHLWKYELISRRAYEKAQKWREGPQSKPIGIARYDFIPEEQIRREEQSLGVVDSEPRKSSHKHKASLYQLRAAIPDIRKRIGFRMPAGTSSSKANQDNAADSFKRMTSKPFRSQTSSSDHEVPSATRAEGISDVAPITIHPSTSHPSDQQVNFSIPVPQTLLSSRPASQDEPAAEHSAVSCSGTNNENDVDCGTNDANHFQETGSSMQNSRMEAAASEPSLRNNRIVGAVVDLESRSSETINSNTGLPEDYPAKSQRDASLSRSSGSPEPGGALTPDSSDSSHGNDALYTSPFHRQVGVARLRIEQLSLFDHETTHCEQYAYVSTHSEGSHSEHDDCPADTEQDASGSQRSGPSGAPPERQCSTTKRTRLSTENEAEAEDSDPDESQGRIKSAQKKQKLGYEGPRFACPYQAFEPSQNCFEPRALNSKGGCENIARLKHHLNRRHKQAYQCRRCWSSFDSRGKVQDHETKNQCEHREMSRTERFMDAQSEAGIENACKSVPAIEAWWNLFRLLIPGMQGRDLQSLIQQYGPNYPYYYRREPNLIIPSVTLSNNFFEPVPQTGPSQETEFHRNSDHQTLFTPRDFNLNRASTTYAMHPVSSQTISVPVLQEFNAEAVANSFVNLHDTGEASISAQGSSSLDFASSSSNLQSFLEMPFMPENTASASSVGNQGQLPRNYERLRKRNIQAEADIVTSRQAVQEAGSDFTLMDNIFEDLLNSGDLPEKLFDKISEASSALTSARRKLKRAAL